MPTDEQRAWFERLSPEDSKAIFETVDEGFKSALSDKSSRGHHPFVQGRHNLLYRVKSDVIDNF